jgi:hypothetical protein
VRDERSGGSLSRKITENNGIGVTFVVTLILKRCRISEVKGESCEKLSVILPALRGKIRRP